MPLKQVIQNLKNRHIELNYGEQSLKEFYHHISIHYSPESALDIGVGAGRDLDNMSPYFPNLTQKIGIDFMDESRDSLGKKNISLEILDLEKDILPFKNESLDIIVANQVYEHLKEIFWVTHQLMRCLKTGGFLIIGVPNLAALHNRLFLLAGKQPTCIQLQSAHLRGFTKPNLVQFMGLFPGIKLVQYKGQNLYPLPGFLSKPITRLLPGIAVGNFYLFQKTGPYRDEFMSYLDTANLETNFFKSHH